MLYMHIIINQYNSSGYLYRTHKNANSLLGKKEVYTSTKTDIWKKKYFFQSCFKIFQLLVKAHKLYIVTNSFPPSQQQQRQK